jgi:hypothetical protein
MARRGAAGAGAVATGEQPVVAGAGRRAHAAGGAALVGAAGGGGGGALDDVAQRGDEVVAALVEGPAVGDLLRRVEHDVEVAAEDDVDAGGELQRVDVVFEADVADHHDDVGALLSHEVDVVLGGLDGVEGDDAEAVGLVEDRGDGREVAHPDDADLEPAEVEEDVGLGEAAELGGARGGGVVELVVGREGLEGAPAGELPGEVEGAAVELVVADDHRVDAGVGEGSHLGLAVEEVEDRGALEAVAGVEVQDAVGVTPLALDEVVHPGGAAEGGLGGVEAEVLVGLVDLLEVREEARVPVRRVQQREAHVAAEVVLLPRAVAADGEEAQRKERKGDRAGHHGAGGRHVTRSQGNLSTSERALAPGGGS